MHLFAVWLEGIEILVCHKLVWHLLVNIEILQIDVIEDEINIFNGSMSFLC